jgi:sortase A
MYKVRFFLSVFLICALLSFYIYKENDRIKSEEVSKTLLESMVAKNNNEETTDNTTKKIINDVLIIALDERQTDTEPEEAPPVEEQTYTTDSGEDYEAEAILKIPCIDLTYPVLSKTSDELLKISLNKYWGNGPNQIGNYCIVGHNYASGKMFGKLHRMGIGDTAILEKDGKSVTYEAYDKFVVEPDDVSCTSQLTGGRREITLITCSNYGTQRLIIKCREI